MYHPVRKKEITITITSILLLGLLYFSYTQAKSFDIPTKEARIAIEEPVNNNVIDFDENDSIQYNKKYDKQWHKNIFNKEAHRYMIIKDDKYTNKNIKESNLNNMKVVNNLSIKNLPEETTTQDFSVLPLELISTTQNILISILESTTELDLTVIPLNTSHKTPIIEINETVTLPSSTEKYESTTYYSTTEQLHDSEELKLKVIPLNNALNSFKLNETIIKSSFDTTTLSINFDEFENITATTENIEETTAVKTTSTSKREINTTSIPITLKLNATKEEDIMIVNSTSYYANDFNTSVNSTDNKNINQSDPSSSESDEDVPIFTELDGEEEKDVPEDYYDSKDIVPTTAPRTDALSVIFGLAGTVVESVVESVAERVVPKSVFDLFKRMQRQSEALEAEKLRSREENGGIGQFTRGIIKSISTGISRPLSQLMAGARDIGSLDTDRGFVASIASGVTSVANVAYSVADAFKDRVQAIYPGTVWCGDGRSATARSSDLGLFFFTDTCCRQHDACKLYIKAGETKYGLTNTGLFTRSHCSCDMKFRECLRKTNSLVSSQIGLTYFNVLGPQCFRRAHPIVRCVRKTRITGLKCEEYELDYTKPRMWQWFDNETF